MCTVVPSSYFIVPEVKVRGYELCRDRDVHLASSSPFLSYSEMLLTSFSPSPWTIRREVVSGLSVWATRPVMSTRRVTALLIRSNLSIQLCFAACIRDICHPTCHSHKDCCHNFYRYQAWTGRLSYPLAPSKGHARGLCILPPFPSQHVLIFPSVYLSRCRCWLQWC